MLRCKAFTLLLFCIWFYSSTSFSHSLIQDTKKEVKIETDGGVLHLIPLNERTVRVSFHKEEKHLYPDELIYSEQVKVPTYRVIQDEETVTLQMA
jgi:hypothetical protein